ncbi:MAG TPA: polysaccharide deacetylase family protein [Candidatus Bathyarchaeia archaeon]
MRPEIWLTFDCEDFISSRSIPILYRILELLRVYDITGLFFLTGHMAEKISNFPDILDMLEDHQIGYHSSAHTVRPTIVEYTDVEDYSRARRISLKRETSHIDPLTGECDGKGGILLLRNIFPKKRVVSFRAPGFCWSPPHLEALRELGILFDFSTDLSPTPITHNGIIFYPFPSLIDLISLGQCRLILKALLRTRLTVFDFHPDYFTNANNWDSIYFAGNPKRLYQPKDRGWRDTEMLLRKFELFLKRLSLFGKSGMLAFTPPLENNAEDPAFTTEFALKRYQTSIGWAKNHMGYNPKFVHVHFMKFFNVS